MATLALLMAAGCAWPWDRGHPSAEHAPPTGVIASSERGVTTVAWDPSEGASSYRVYFASAPGIDLDDAFEDSPIEQRDFVGLPIGVEHYFRVQAVYPDGRSDLSEEVSSVPTNGFTTRGSSFPADPELQGGLHVDETGVYVTWVEDRTKEVRFARSADLGATWRNFVVALQESPADTFSLASSHVVRRGSRIYLPHTNYHQPRLATSGDGGETWDIAPLPATTFPIDLVFDGEEAYLLTFGEETGGHAVLRLVDGGFAPVASPPGDRPSVGCLFVAGDTITVAYESLGPSAAQWMRLSRSVDGGRAWAQSDIELVAESGYNCAVAERAGVLVVTYGHHEYRDGRNFDQLWLSRSVDGGRTFERTVLDAMHEWSSPQTILWDEDGALRIVYYRQDGALVLATSSDLGLSFTTRVVYEGPPGFASSVLRARVFDGRGHALFESGDGLTFATFPLDP